MKIIEYKDFRVLVKPADGNKVVFVFTAFGTKFGLYSLFIKRMNKLGYTCVLYDYPAKVAFEYSPAGWEEFLSRMVADAQRRMVSYKQQDITNFYAYGVSLGTLFAGKLARSSPDIEHVILNVAYGDFASNLWTYRGVKKTKENLTKLGYSLESTRDGVAFMDLIATAKELRDKKVLLQLSRTDKINVREQTQQTTTAFENNIPNLTYIENKYLGHYLGGTKNMLSIKVINNFYES